MVMATSRHTPKTRASRAKHPRAVAVATLAAVMALATSDTLRRALLVTLVAAALAATLLAIASARGSGRAQRSAGWTSDNQLGGGDAHLPAGLETDSR